PNLALHLRSGSQTTRNRTLSTKEIFRLQQLQKKSQRGNDEISQEKQDTAKQQQISTSTDTEPYQQPVLSAEQRAHLEARKRKHYEQEQARIREENYQRQLQAMRDQQEALNLQRYNQLYPRNRDHRLHGDQRQSADVPSRTKEASRGNAQAASHNHSQNHIAHTQTQYNGHETEHPEVRTNQFDSEALRRAHAEAEAHRASAGDSLHRSEAEDQTRRVHTGADDRRAQEIAEARRAEEEARIKQASQEQIPQTNVDTRSYDAWQMEYYRQLQEHRRQYAEQIRQRQLRERERELRYREELLRNRYNLDAARALAMQRRQQQLLASASEADNRLQTLNTVQQRTSLQQPSEDKTGYGDQQRNLQIDNTARSWFEDGNGRAYLRQRMNVNLLELPPTTVPPVEMTTERRSDAEVRRAQAKARKRARFEKLKKLERMGLLPLRTTSARKPMTTAPPSPFVQTLDEELRPTVIRPSLYRSWPNSADSRSKSLLSQGKPRSREEILTREDIRSNIPVQLPEASSSTRGLDSVKQATELRNEVVKTADRIFEGDEIVRSEVINAEEKNEPFNNGKQIISLDDYDDEEWIEEDYDVDEYGRRLPEEDETAILDRWSSWREDTLLTSPDAQAERFVDENSSVSLMAVHPSRISKYMVSSTHEKPPFEVFPTAVSKTWEESTTPAYRGAELTPSFPLPVTHFRKGSITSSLSSTANPPVSPTETEASSKATLISGTADFELTYPRRTYTSATTATKEPPKASDTRTSPVVLDRATAVVGLKEHGRKTEGVHADVEDEQVDEDDYDTEDLFFWKPEYENNRLQKSVRDDETNGKYSVSTMKRSSCINLSLSSSL
ncbi:unnamed protein product, partial [Toxocara canis]|uniref:Trichohyalin n=1 Tax=Toxocara canis TaxID=6265 RepID=A0A183TWE6_TOXCA